MNAYYNRKGSGFNPTDKIVAVFMPPIDSIEHLDNDR
jgi:hypothetical protein